MTTSPVRISILPGLVVRDLRRIDAEPFRRLIGDKTILKMIWGRIRPYTTKDARHHILKNRRRYPYQRKLIREGTGKKISFAITFQNELIGGVGYTPDSDTAEIGYWLGRKYWGQGYMPHIVKKFCWYLRAEYGIHYFTAKTFTFNSRSGRVLEKSGFRKMAIAVEDEKIGRKYLDHILYAAVMK